MHVYWHQCLFCITLASGLLFDFCFRKVFSLPSKNIFSDKSYAFRQKNTWMPEPSLLSRKKRDTLINVTALETMPSAEECGKAVRQSACRLLDAHNIGYVWLWPVALGPPNAMESPLQTATTTAAALNNVMDMCSGKKASAPYGNLKFCVCYNVLDTIYNYAADQMFFSVPVYSLTVLDATTCPSSQMTSSTGAQLPIGFRTSTNSPQPNGRSVSLIELPGFHVVDFTCGFENDDGSFSGAVSICSQVAQFCANAITKHQFIMAAINNYSTSVFPTTGKIEVLPFTENGCGRKFASQFSIRCTIPCSYTL